MIIQKLAQDVHKEFKHLNGSELSKRVMESECPFLIDTHLLFLLSIST